MPRKEPENAEQILISLEDAELLDFFHFRRTFFDDGSIRYVQLIGDPVLLDAFARGEPLVMPAEKTKKARQASLARVLVQRMIGRPLMGNEKVVQKNGKRGDNRRQNLELTTSSEIAGGERIGTWSATGAKYVYKAANGKYYAQVGDNSLGTYDKVEQANDAVSMYREMVESGVPEVEAATRVLNRGRNRHRIAVQE